MKTTIDLRLNGDELLRLIVRCIGIEMGNILRSRIGGIIRQDALRDTMRIEMSHDVEDLIVSVADRYRVRAPDDGHYNSSIAGVSYYVCRYVPAPGWRLINPLMAELGA